MTTVPPLDHAHVNQRSGLPEPEGSPAAEEIERRVQELLKEFFGRYFNGQPFETGGESRTFARCDLLWGQAVPPDPLEVPLIHTLLIDRRDRDRERGRPGYWSHESRFTWNLLVRCHPQAPAAGSALTPGDARTHAQRSCRRLADQLRWLLTSPHVADLSLKGITDIRVPNGPREIAAGAWFLRQLVVTAQVRWEEPTHEGG